MKPPYTEHLGHALTAFLLGSDFIELGAFYVDYDETGMSILAWRLVALAGPVVSLLMGIVSFLVLHRLTPSKPARYYFVWLLGTVGLMTATGYLDQRAHLNQKLRFESGFLTQNRNFLSG